MGLDRYPYSDEGKSTGTQDVLESQFYEASINRRNPMLVLSRKKDEKIVIGDSITLMVIEIRGDRVRIGIDAPRDVTVHREEIYEAIKRESSGLPKPDE